MMDRANAFARLVSWLSSAAVAVLVVGLAGGAPCLAAPEGPGHPTLDPQPPMTLTIEMLSLQKSTAGGVASLLLRLSADIGVEDAVVSAKAPGNLVFADGSAVKTWNVDLTAAGTTTIPVEVIVPQDGKYVIAAEVSGTARSKPIHRGAALKLLVGIKEPAARVRGGAIEYQAAEAGEPAP